MIYPEVSPPGIERRSFSRLEAFWDEIEKKGSITDVTGAEGCVFNIDNRKYQSNGWICSFTIDDSVREIYISAKKSSHANRGLVWLANLPGAVERVQLSSLESHEASSSVVLPPENILEKIMRIEDREYRFAFVCFERGFDFAPLSSGRIALHCCKFADDGKDFVDTVLKCDRSLHLRACKASREGFPYLHRLITADRRSLSLCIYSCGLSSDECTAINSETRNSLHSVELELDEVSFPDGGKSLLNSMKNGRGPVMYAKSRFDSSLDGMLVSQGIGMAINLRKLRLPVFSTVDVRSFGRALQKNKSLEHLTLQIGPTISSDKLQSILEAVGHHPCLRVLDINFRDALIQSANVNQILADLLRNNQLRNVDSIKLMPDRRSSNDIARKLYQFNAFERRFAPLPSCIQESLLPSILQRLPSESVMFQFLRTRSHLLCD